MLKSGTLGNWEFGKYRRVARKSTFGCQMWNHVWLHQGRFEVTHLGPPPDLRSLIFNHNIPKTNKNAPSNPTIKMTYIEMKKRISTLYIEIIKKLGTGIRHKMYISSVHDTLVSRPTQPSPKIVE